MNKVSHRINASTAIGIALVLGAALSPAKAMSAGDAALLHGESQLRLESGEDAEVLVFDLAA